MIWQNIEKRPELEQYCEYKIVITCRGWFEPEGEEPRFCPDDRHAPIGVLTAWRPVETNQTRKEAQKEIDEIRKKRQEQPS